MRHFQDDELKGHAMIYDGPLDLIEHARQACEGNPKALIEDLRVNWPGRKGNSWKELEDFLHNPWPEGVEMVRGVIERIKKMDLPKPKDIRRKGRWSEDDGEIDFDRIMSGEPEYMRETKRIRTSAPFTISIIANLDLAGGSHCNPSGVFFRSAAAIGLADILEELGYSVEIWTWQLGYDVYPEPYPDQFIACSPKKAGNPVDADALCDTMSSWFMSKAIWGAMSSNPKVAPISGGSAAECNEDAIELKDTGMQGWEKYLDIEQGSIPVCIPMIRGWSRADGLDTCGQQCLKILQKIIEYQA